MSVVGIMRYVEEMRDKEEKRSLKSALKVSNLPILLSL